VIDSITVKKCFAWSAGAHNAPIH